ncbi:13953_t:CDS:1, partial [Cetraspora pellucida]
CRRQYEKDASEYYQKKGGLLGLVFDTIEELVLKERARNFRTSS